MIEKDKFKYHETAEVSPDAKIGEGTNIWNHAQIRENARIGKKCNIGKNCYIDFDVTIGDGVKLQNNVSVWHGVTLEDDVFVGPCAVFTNDLRPRAFIWDDNRLETILVKKGASIGANSTIICGNRVIGEYAMVAAGSVVTKDVPDHGLVVGVPARLVGYVCKCCSRLKETGKSDGFLEMECTDPDCKFEKHYRIKEI
ncbi:N-acetyltransferase [Candidatus Woesearchaeota archaeon]|nr:N-acetyltransferase [Candidatus Woesearchaeota archaeon]